jgi:preprotein translocase subunit SecA
MSRPLTSPFSGVFCRRTGKPQSHSMPSNNESSAALWSAQTPMRSLSNHLHFFCGKYKTEIEAAYAVDLMQTFITPDRSEKRFYNKETGGKPKTSETQLNVSTAEHCEEVWRPYLKDYAHLRSVDVIDVKLRPALRKIVSESVEKWVKNNGSDIFENITGLEHSKDSSEDESMGI